MIRECPANRSLFINREKQQTVAWCWAASTRTVMEYKNQNKAQAEPTALQCDIVRNVLSLGLGGTNCCEIQVAPDFIDAPSVCVQGGWPYWVLNKYHFSYEWVDGRFDDWETLKAEICKVGPVISVIDWSGGGSHTLVITGYSTDSDDVARVVTTYDPFTDDFQDLSFEEFVGGSTYRSNAFPRFSHNRTYVQIMPMTEGHR
ncbi:MAG: hypothetical protein IPM58_05680 [Nitrospira sp.]|nr:hypothetical protein [Nitrospira sp.]